MILFYRHEKVFFLGLCFFFSTIGMNDKSPREIVNPTPGCIRQNSHELRKTILELAKAQGNQALIKELQEMDNELSKKEKESNKN